MLVLSGGDIETLVDDLQQVPVLQGGGDPLLVGQLLVDGGLAGVRARADRDRHLEPVRQRAQQLHPDREADQSGHAAVRDGGGEHNLDVVLVNVNCYLLLSDNVQLLQCQWMLRVIYISYQIKYFSHINRVFYCL